MPKEYTPVEKANALEDFQLFLFSMDDVLELFIKQAEASGIVLDYSLDSLDRLESYTITLDTKPLSDFHGHASQYLGETVRKTFGGRWELSLNMKENSMNYGKPVIVGHTTYEVEFPPYEFVARFMRKKTSGFLKQVVLNDVNPIMLDLSNLPTENEEPTEGK